MKLHFGRNKDGFTFDADITVEEIAGAAGGLFGGDEEEKPKESKSEEPAKPVDVGGGRTTCKCAYPVPAGTGPDAHLCLNCKGAIP